MAAEYLKDITVFRHGGRYSKADLLQMDPVPLRALLRERVHHTIEVEVYPLLVKKTPVPPSFGMEPELVWEVMRERGLLKDWAPGSGDDLDWAHDYLEKAKALRAGKDPGFKDPLPEPFTPEEMAVVHKLLWGRRSIRDWVPGKKVPKELIEQILEAGRAAPLGCNLGVVRFVVIDDPEEAKMCWSDIPTPMDACTLIVICYDDRVYKATGGDTLVAHNQGFDCAAAGDHMLLMAHALGLGGVWLTCTEKTATRFQKQYGLPDYVIPAMHIAIGYASIGSVKSQRLPLKDMVISRNVK